MTVNVLGRRLPATATYAATLGAMLLLLVLTVAGALLQSNSATMLNQHLRETAERRSHYRNLLQHVIDAETAQRGFLLTGDEAYLAPLAGARTSADRELGALEADAGLPASVRNELPSLRDSVERKFDEMELTIDLQERGQTARALAIVRADEGKQLMDDIRRYAGSAMNNDELDLWSSLDESAAAGERLRWVIILAGLILVALGTVLVITVRNAMKEMRITRDEAVEARKRAFSEMEAREQAETKVRQMQKMEAIGQLTGGVAHDFNNMLAVIMSALQLARRRMDRGEPGAEKFLDEAMDGSRRAATLTNRLLAFARRKPLSPQVIDINRVLSEMSDLLHRTLGEQIALETVLSAGVWRVNVDRSELEQAILNICVNARDAMGEGGKLTIEAANAYLDDAYGAANDVAPGQHVLIAITDTGAGMPKETAAKAFEPFFTTKEVGKGTGLGLSQVHGFLKQSGGHAAIYSELGHGTTVKLYLPRTQLPEAEEVAELPQEVIKGDPAIIVLVVEDEDRVRMLSVESLRELGYTVLHASGGAHALDVLDKHPGISLLFTDVIMPEMNGKVLSDEARRRRPELKVLFTTGYTQNAIVHNGVLDADARLLLKPYTLQDLARKVRAVLDE